MTHPNTRYAFFLSYSSEDSRFVRQLVNQLSAREITPWWDKEIQRTWRSEIDTQIDVAPLVVVVVTPASMKSAYVTYEWSRAWFRNGVHPYLVYLTETSAGMFSRLSSEIQLHPSSAYLKQGEDAVSEDVLNRVVQDLTEQVNACRDLVSQRDIVVDRHKSVGDRIASTERLAGVPPHLEHIARKILIDGIEQQMEANSGYGPLQQALVRELGKYPSPAIFPLLERLKRHTQDKVVQEAIDTVIRNMLR